MPNRYQKHYTPDEARELLPQLREWLDKLAIRRLEHQEMELQLAAGENSSWESGGDLVNRSVKSLVDIKKLFQQFQTRQIQIKDIDRGLIDFPAFVEGREVFLCWEKDEADIGYWHDIDSGYAHREAL